LSKLKQWQYRLNKCKEGENMKRQEAILLLSRILNSCKGCDLTFVSLDHPNPKANLGSDGYELRFKCSIDDRSFNKIKEIVNEHHLGFQEYEDGRLIIYTPKRELHNLTIIV
jgi:hypothetical protein